MLGQTDGRTDTVPLHRPCSAYYYAGCASNLQLTVSVLRRACILTVRLSRQSYLKNHTSPVSMCICCLWPWLGPFLGGVAICYVVPVLCTVSCLYCWSNSSLSVTQQRRSRANAPATWYWMCPIIDNSRCQESVVHENRVRSLRCTLALFRYSLLSF